MVASAFAISLVSNPEQEHHMRKNIFAAASFAILLAACSSQPPVPEQKAAPTTPAALAKEQTPAPASAPVAQQNVDEFGLAQLNNPNSLLSKRSVFFDYDQFMVKDEFKSLIAAHAKFLVHNPGSKMLIQGNADERGSHEYNLALGTKRAEAVKKLLIVLGAKEAQIEAVSLGKEKPRCTDSSEGCWSQERRDDALYTGEY
jgi:peptidoglycan-associated lipoprotein